MKTVTKVTRKVCNDCGRRRNVKFFSRDVSCADNLRGDCRACHNAKRTAMRMLAAG